MIHLFTGVIVLGVIALNELRVRKFNRQVNIIIDDLDKLETFITHKHQSE